jgi:hypothetical protein
MLTAAQALRVERRRRPRPSAKQQYHEYILQKIEAYKNSLQRDQLLRLGDEANQELQAAAEGQFVLTEILMLDSVDELIKRRLKLKPFGKWKTWIKALRVAQREPTHWGLEPECPVAALLRRLEHEDEAVVVGGAADGTAFLLAAHEVPVTFLAGDLGSVDRVESRVEDESLAVQIVASVVDFELWCPPLPDVIAITVLDAGEVGDLDPMIRSGLIAALQYRTPDAGVHVLLPGRGRMAPEALLHLYDGWVREEVGKPRRRGSRSHGIVLARTSAEPKAVRPDGVAVC